jgi:hypothetical protein
VVLSEILRKAGVLGLAAEAAGITERRQREAYLSYLEMLTKVAATSAVDIDSGI